MLAALVVGTYARKQQVAINELGFGADRYKGAEFVELTNLDIKPVDLSRFRLDFVEASAGADTVTIYRTLQLPSHTLKPNSYFVICADASVVGT